MEDERQSRQQAYERVNRARVGSLADPSSEEYLVYLRRFALEWAAEIERAIVRRAERVRHVL